MENLRIGDEGRSGVGWWGLNFEALEFVKRGRRRLESTRDQLDRQLTSAEATCAG